jgi:hypothetical protein
MYSILVNTLTTGIPSGYGGYSTLKISKIKGRLFPSYLYAPVKTLSNAGHSVTILYSSGTNVWA